MTMASKSVGPPGLGTSRRFSLLDAMVLVAALAVGLGLCRTLGNYAGLSRAVTVSRRVDENTITSRRVEGSVYFDRMNAFFYRSRAQGETIYWAERVAFWPGLILAPLTVSVAALRTWPGMSPQSRRDVSPGGAACLAFLLAAAVTLVDCPMILVDRVGTSVDLKWADWWVEFWFSLPRAAGFAVAVAWMVLAAGGRWARETETLGWLARLLGASWVIMALAGLVAAWVRVIPI